ncbi:hypothetical protein MBLNU13_g05492t1 [Cladosporium sp. NU13]
MVGLATTSLLGFLALLQPTIAAPRNLMKPLHTKTCISNGNLYHSGTSYLMFGNSYFVHCGKDSTGQVLQTLTVPGGGFSDCSQTCGILDGCGGFSFIGGIEDGACYFKTGLGDLANAFGDAVSCSLDPEGNGIHPEPVPEPWFPPHDEPVPASYPSSDGHESTSLTASAPVASSYALVASSSASVASSPASVDSTYVSGNTGSPSSAPAVSSPSLSLSAYTSPLASPTAAAPTPSALDQCQQTVKNSGDIYRGGNGSPYELECGEDHYGGDLTAVGSDTFLGCINVCNANPECIGYSYLGGVCYLKEYLTAPDSNPAVNFALNLDRNSTAKPPPSSTSAAATSPTATPEHAPGSCGYITAIGFKTYTDRDNVRYTIECDTDHNGGDIGAVGAKDFVDCMDACDKKDKCIAFSWVGGNGPGTCYMKGTITDIEHDVDVDYAYKKTPTDILASSTSLASSYGRESTSAGVTSTLAPPATSVSLSSWSYYPSVPPVASSWSSDSGGVLTVTVTSYTGSATPSSSSKQRIIHPQPNTHFPWPLWPNPTKLPPTKAPHRHPSSVHEPLPEPASATSYSSPANTKTAWLTSALPTPFVPDVPPPNSPDGPPSPPFGVPPFDPLDRPHPHPPNEPPSPPFGQPPKIPYGVPPFNIPNGQPPNPPNGPRPKPYGVPRIPYFGEPPFFPPNVRRSVPEEPTKTYTKKPLEPTSVGDNAYCEQLRSRKPKKLHCKVTHGDYKFNGMWVQDPTRAHDSSIAHLTNSTQEAAYIDLNPWTGAIVSWHDEEGCDFRGLNMMPPDPKQPHGSNGRFEKHGDCIFSPRHGASGMFLEDGVSLSWHHLNFANFLACDSDNAQEVELKFWETKVHGTWREEPRRCAAVKLTFVDVD